MRYRVRSIEECWLLFHVQLKDCVITSKLTINSEPTSSAGDVKPSCVNWTPEPRLDRRRYCVYSGKSSYRTAHATPASEPSAACKCPNSQSRSRVK